MTGSFESAAGSPFKFSFSASSSARCRFSSLERAGAEVRRDGSRLAVAHDDDPFTVVRDALAATGTPLRSLGVRTTSLEDIFLETDE